MAWLRPVALAVGVAILALPSLAAGDPTEPLDGGYPIDLDPDPVGKVGCTWRRERGGWHLSTGHCEEMMPIETMTGVFITGFEEASNIPGATAIPDPDDPRRYRYGLEVDERRIQDLAGPRPPHPAYVAIQLTFQGRRTRYPYSIDCFGKRAYAFVAYRLLSARYLGAIPDPDFDKDHRADKPFPRSGEGGRIAQLEQRALEHCFPE